MRVILAVLMSGLFAAVACSKKNGDDGGFFDPSSAFSDSSSFFSSNLFSTEVLGDRGLALQLASQLKLSSNFDIINADLTKNFGLSLNGQSYDDLQTSEYTFDPSTSMLREIKKNTCVLSKIDYEMLPTSSKSRTADISICLAKAKKNGGDGNQSGALNDNSNRTAIFYKSFVNINHQLIVFIKYTAQPENEWEGERDVRGVFVISEAPNLNNPLGNFMLLVGSGRRGEQWSDQQIEMISSKMDTEIGPRSLVRYRESKWGNAKLLQGVFRAENGKILGGDYVASLEGWDETSGEPGGKFRVNFDEQYLKREKRIDNPEEFFGGETPAGYNNAPVTQCYKPKEFVTSVFGYRGFQEDGSELDVTTGFEVSNSSRTLQGYADYWGANFYDRNTGYNLPVTDGTIVYEVDWENYNNETNEPGLKSVPYVVHVKPGKLTKHTVVALAMSKLEGKPLDWFYDYDTGSSFRVRWDNAAGKFWKTAKWVDDPNPTGPGGSWQTLAAEEEYNAYDGYSMSTWNDGLGGNIMITRNGSTYTATLEKQELMTDDSGVSSQLVCLYDCPKVGGISASTLREFQEGDYEAARAKTYYGSNTQEIADVKTYDYSDYTLSIGGSDVKLTGTPNEGEYLWGVWTSRLIPKPAFDAAVAGNGGATHTYEIDSAFTEWYSYELGFEAYQKTIWLTKNNVTVAFTPPRAVQYTLSQDDLRSGGVGSDKVGQLYRIELNGEYLNIPWESTGFETDAITGETWEKWTPAFALKDGIVLTDVDGAKFKIKADYVEHRMVEASLSECDYLSLPDENSFALPEKSQQLFEDQILNQ